MDDDSLDELVAHSPAPDGHRVGPSEPGSDAGKLPAVGRVTLKEQWYVVFYSGCLSVFNFQPLKKHILSGHWWLMPISLATQEAEIRRIGVGKGSQTK
jgi:hypothetical protein